jgi:hypothetical protein
MHPLERSSGDKDARKGRPLRSLNLGIDRVMVLLLLSKASRHSRLCTGYPMTLVISITKHTDSAANLASRVYAQQRRQYNLETCCSAAGRAHGRKTGGNYFCSVRHFVGGVQSASRSSLMHEELLLRCP